MPSWFDKMVGGTRGQLLVLLRRSRRTITELAQLLGITDNAVRAHVMGLERDGLVEATGVDRATGGKPAQVYGITPAAEELFPKAYATVLSGLVALLEEKQGSEAVADLLRELGARVGAEQLAAGHGAPQRVEAAASVLRSLGGDVEVETTSSGWLLRGHGCPLSAVVGERPEVCLLAEAVVAEITGKPVVECCDRSGRPSCRLQVTEG